MAIQFCDVCGDTLPILSSAVVKCDCCGETNQNTLLSTTVTSTTNNFPSKLREKLSTTQVLTAEDKRHAFLRINEECPACQAKELTFSQAQLRGADEGTTIFYYCLSCRHRFTTNN